MAPGANSSAAILLDRLFAYTGDARYRACAEATLEAFAGIAPQYRGKGISTVLLRRMAGLAAAHGLDSLIAPVRPTWKERYPLTPIERYVLWRREDGYPYDPWLRTHERVGAELLEVCPLSMTVKGSRDQWEEWTGLQFPEDGDYVVPGALVPVGFVAGVGTYIEPNVWMLHRV